MLLVLFIIQIILFIYAINKSISDTDEKRMLYTSIFIMCLWAIGTSYFSYTGLYQSESFSNSLPGFWITSLLPNILFVFIAVSKKFRTGIIRLYASNGRKRVLVFQSLRIFALGGIVKTFTGDFTPLFGKVVGIPDFLFSLLVFYALFNLSINKLSKKLYIITMVFGIFVIIPVGMVIINISLPGVMFINDFKPSIMTLFDYPLVLAPTLVVPIFIFVGIISVLIELNLLKK